MEFRILGPLQVFDDGREVTLASAKERELLAVLLLHAGAVVSRDRLIEELWGETPPPTAPKALNVHVSQLRKRLGQNGRGPVATRAPGYALDVEPEAVDAARFQQLVADAQAQIAGGDVALARRLLGEALGLWRGRALDGVELAAATRNEIARLEELRLAGAMDRIDCDLALGLHEQVIGELEALVSAHPLRERIRGQLMLALYRSGRQADALAVYHDTRKTLVDELGLVPSAALQRLERGILNHDPSLEAPTGVRRPERHPLPDAPRASRRRRRLLMLGGALAIVGAAAAVAVATTGRQQPVRVPANAIAVIDPATNSVTRAIPVGVRPTAIVPGRDTAWVLNRGSATISEIDARRVKPVRTIRLGGYPGSLVVSGRTAWVQDAATRAVTAINLDDRRRFVRRASGSSRPTTPSVASILVAADHVLWTTKPWPSGLVPVAPTHGPFPPPETRRGSISLPDIPDSAASGGDLWLTSSTAGTLTVVDAASRLIAGRRVIGPSPVAVAVGRDAAWVATAGDNAVARIDRAVFRVVKKIHLSATPTALALDPPTHSLWVVSGKGGTVTRIDTRRNRVVETIRLGNEPTAAAIVHGRVWVTVARA